ncbi:unnamed protein product [Haemonchus placei]|uniref:Uncharacterized protein n=1 Tax=Haemonchus placei TaxID=6290 RepID=A0A3P7UXD0_HAEPC|nr:unnamed protein product [Haemonchus placei]
MSRCADDEPIMAAITAMAFGSNGMMEFSWGFCRASCASSGDGGFDFIVGFVSSRESSEDFTGVVLAICVEFGWSLGMFGNSSSHATGIASFRGPGCSELAG